MEKQPSPHVAGELILLFVAPDRLRRGVGSRLVGGLEEELQRRQVARYRVAVRSQLAEAQAFYRAAGFGFEQEARVLGEPMAYFLREL